MLEYLFFHEQFCTEFIRFLESRGVSYRRESESVQQAKTVLLSEELDEDLIDSIDEKYDELFEKDSAMLETSVEDEHSLDTAGIYLELAGGQQTVARIDPDVMNRMLSVITMEELREFIETIVSSVEQPDDSPLCKTPGS